MNGKPIIFSSSMVRAILNTKPGVWPAEPIDPSRPFKWMTRRVVTRINGAVSITEFGKSNTPGYDWHFRDKHLRWHDVNYIIPPYHKGYILWVRETWKKVDGTYIFLADYPPGIYPCRMTSPIFMPREAARITLEVKNVRIERIQDITEEDAIGEGCNLTSGAEMKANMPLHPSYRISFMRLWETLNAKRGYSWESNPYVFVYEFMRIK
jgi:hypothetical protein